MYIKKLMKKQLSLSAATLFLIIFIVFGSSYALFENTQTDTKEQQLNVGDLVIAFKNANDTDLSDADAINITDIDPMTDTEGLAQTNNLYSFVIKNTGTIAYEYTVKLIDNPAYLSGGTSYDSSKVLLAHNYIRCNLTGLNGTKTINNDTFSLGDKTNNIITKFVVNPGETISYALRLWVADATEYQLPNEAIGAEIHLNILIEGEASDYGYQMANLIKNGGFESSISSDNWIANNDVTAETVTSGGLNDSKYLKITPTSIYGLVKSNDINVPSSHVIYSSAYYRKSGGGNTIYRVYDITGDVAAINDSGNIADDTTTWTKISIYGTNASSNVLNTLLYGSSSNFVESMYTEWDNVLTIDLTETFGEGNEPTKEWCDANIEWFEGSKIIYKY